MAKPSPFKYAVKFLCLANIPGTSAMTPSVVSGAYQTVINIFNPNRGRANLVWKLCLPGFGSEPHDRVLDADECARLSCDDIAKGSGVTAIHGLEGFVIIESDRSLDVTAVYTASGVNGFVESIDVEQIRERQMS